jgi:hypothetical protein
MVSIIADPKIFSSSLYRYPLGFPCFVVGEMLDGSVDSFIVFEVGAGD